MLIVGLTGSIGMGKSTVAAHLRALGIGVFDADACVHALYAAGGVAVPLVEAAFPGTTSVITGVDRSRLAAALGDSADQFKRLEAIVHPLVREAERVFLAAEAALGASFAVLEIPLLFETGAQALVDVVMMVSADAATQRARVLARPGMTPARFATILSRQMGDGEKRARADFVVDTGIAITDTQAQIEQVLRELEGRAGRAYHETWERRFARDRS
jgi:dephospho-CoA kinase